MALWGTYYCHAHGRVGEVQEQRGVKEIAQDLRITKGWFLDSNPYIACTIYHYTYCFHELFIPWLQQVSS